MRIGLQLPIVVVLSAAAGAARADCAQLVGEWEWTNGYIYLFTEDGRWNVTNGAFVGDWTCEVNDDGDSEVEIIPDSGTWSATVVITPDGQKLEGEMGGGLDVEAVRLPD